MPAKAGIQEMRRYYVYILASRKNGTIYIGVTNNLILRVREHRQGLVDGFTKKYKVYQLVYFETYTDIRDAITREKRLKKWKREWKGRLIEERNQRWADLYSEIR